MTSRQGGIDRALAWLLLAAAMPSLACHRACPVEPSGDAGAVFTASSTTSPAQSARTGASVDLAAPPVAGPSGCAAAKPAGRPSPEAFSRAREARGADELARWMATSAAGAPERLALVVDGTFGAGCECPPFLLHFADANAVPAGVELLPVVADKGVATLHAMTHLRFILVGYFSGKHRHLRVIPRLGRTAAVAERRREGDVARAASRVLSRSVVFRGAR